MVRISARLLVTMPEGFCNCLQPVRLVRISPRLLVTMPEGFCNCLQPVRLSRGILIWVMTVSFRSFTYLLLMEATALHILEINQCAIQQIIKKHKQGWNYNNWNTGLYSMYREISTWHVHGRMTSLTQNQDFRYMGLTLIKHRGNFILYLWLALNKVFTKCGNDKSGFCCTCLCTQKPQHEQNLWIYPWLKHNFLNMLHYIKTVLSGCLLRAFWKWTHGPNDSPLNSKVLVRFSWLTWRCHRD
jgi:hypothetical protein